MTNNANIPLPQWYIDDLERLNKFCADNPEEIKIKDCAKFLHMKVAGLRRYIEQNPTSFGICWQLEKDVLTPKGRKTGDKVKCNRSFKIYRVPFYNWYTQHRLQGDCLCKYQK